MSIINRRNRPMGWGQVPGVKELEAAITTAQRSLDYWAAEAGRHRQKLAECENTLGKLRKDIEELEGAIDKLVGAKE